MSLDSGIFDFDDEITGVALIGIDRPCDPNTGGDFDGDGTVEFGDFLFLANNFGGRVDSHEQGDLNCDGEVEFGAFLIFANNFGKVVEAEASSVAEPSGLALLGIAGLLLGGFRRRP